MSGCSSKPPPERKTHVTRGWCDALFAATPVVRPGCASACLCTSATSVSRVEGAAGPPVRLANRLTKVNGVRKRSLTGSGTRTRSSWGRCLAEGHVHLADARTECSWRVSIWPYEQLDDGSMRVSIQDVKRSSRTDLLPK